jgi:hypothetical protein
MSHLIIIYINSNIDISGQVAIGKNTAIVSLDISGNDAIRLPVGTVIQRPIKNMGDGTFQDPAANVITTKRDDYIGSIRYNSDNSQFEGFGPGNEWGSLGGVINVAQNTKILAESSAAATNNELQFYTDTTDSIITGGVERMRIKADGDISMNHNLAVGGNTTINGTLDVSGDIQLNGTAISLDSLSDVKATGLEPGGLTSFGLGRGALNKSTSKYNTAIGVRALNLLDSGTSNVAIGFDAGYNAIGNNCTFLGTEATADPVTVNNSTAIGYQAVVTANNQIMLGTVSQYVVIPGTQLNVAGVVAINNATPSTSKTTGALTVVGGVGITENANIGGTLGVTGISTLGSTTRATISAAGVVAITNATTSTSKTTGALTVVGGVGITENANIGGTLDVTGVTTLGTATVSASGVVAINNATTSTSINTGALTVIGGVGITENANIGGTLDVTGISTLGSTTGATVSAAGVVAISNATSSTDSASGALTVVGGVGITENANIGGTLDVTGISTLGSTTGATVSADGVVAISNATSSTDSASGALTVVGGVGITENANIGGTLGVTGISTLGSTTGATVSADGVVAISNSTTSTTINTGALTVVGGVGITENANIGGNASITGSLTVTGGLTINGVTTTVNTANMSVTDSLVGLSSGTSGVPVNDSGFIIERGNETNVFMGWDEASDKFVMGTTVATDLSSGALTMIASSTLVANIEGTIGAFNPTTGNFTSITDGTATLTGGNLSTTGTIGSGAITSTAAVQGTSITDGTATMSSGALSGVTTIGSGAITSTGAVQGASITDGTATMTAGALSGVTTIASGAITSTGAVQGTSITDGTATMSSGALSGVTTIGSGAITSTGAVQGTSITDGTATMSSGALSGVTTIGSGAITTTGNITMTGKFLKQF